ncbi:putative anaerobic ribonucleoside-triphosphate reductase activating protein [Chondrocystis sp. NIES-4102]|nr:putative anaerobic ribonucleoside-triphosphate reductase activating protein [Chondrocystis sp. NIES-4102]
MKQTNSDAYLKLLEIPPGHLNIMGYVDQSQVNGPGSRAVVWLQGSFNSDSWSFEINQLISVEHLVEKILNNPNNTGVTFSGGEPFWQAPALTDVAKKVKAAGLNVMSFTGFSLERLQSEYAPACSQELLAQLDILIDSVFVKSLAVNEHKSIVSSCEQNVHIFNPKLQDKLDWAREQIEINILKDGSRIITGFGKTLEN